jgi:hypothetical protein
MLSRIHNKKTATTATDKLLFSLAMMVAVFGIFNNKKKNLISFQPSSASTTVVASAPVMSQQQPHYITSTMSNDCVSSGKNQIAPSWCLDTSGTARYVGSTSASSNANDASIHRIKNGTVAEKKYRNWLGFKKCLANKHIVLIGDSRVRYQYMNLAHFLTTGQWMKCKDYKSLTAAVNYTLSPRCYLIDHERGGPGKSRSWNDWYSKSNEDLQQNTTQQELCDCHRIQNPFKTQTTNENRYLRRHTPFGLVQVTYIQNFVDKLQFHAEFPPFSDVSTTNGTDVRRCKPGNCSHPFSNVSDTKTALLEVVPLLRPTHVFASTGWAHNLNDPGFGCALDTFRSQNPSVEAAFVITHPMLARSEGPKPTVPEQGCNSSFLDRITPTIGVPASWFWDTKHLLSIVNQEFNHMMLDKICGGLDLEEV